MPFLPIQSPSLFVHHCPPLRLNTLIIVLVSQKVTLLYVWKRRLHGLSAQLVLVRSLDLAVADLYEPKHTQLCSLPQSVGTGPIPWYLLVLSVYSPVIPVDTSFCAFLGGIEGKREDLAIPGRLLSLAPRCP